jgi:hypothetical protein
MPPEYACKRQAFRQRWITRASRHSPGDHGGLGTEWAPELAWSLLAVRCCDFTIMSRAPPYKARGQAGTAGREIPARRPFRRTSWSPDGSARIRAGGPVVDPRRGAPTPAAAPRSPGRGPPRRSRCHARRSRRGCPRRLCIMRALRRLPQRSSFGLFPGFRRMRDGMAMQEFVEQEGGGGWRRLVDGSDRSSLGLGRRTAR